MPLIERLIQFSNKHRLLSHFLFWLGLYILFLLRYDPYDKYNNTLFNDMLDWGVCVVISALAAYYISYRFIPGLMRSQRYLMLIIECIFFSYILSAILRITVVYFIEPMMRKPPVTQESVSEILTDTVALFHGYFLDILSIAFFFVFTKMVKDQYLGNKRSLELEKQKSESELAALKAQLNPHFLFNTLNNIYSLTLTKSPAAPGAVARLSDILDHLLYRCSEMYVPVSKEITLLQNYIEMEKMRYDDRLHVNFTHHTDYDGKIAPLILLSLVENAFKHGAGEDAGNPVIDINLRISNHIFFFQVSNSFVKQENTNENERIGLNNIRKQLELVYPGVHSFNTTVENGHFTATLQIQLTGKQ